MMITPDEFLEANYLVKDDNKSVYEDYLKRHSEVCAESPKLVRNLLKGAVLFSNGRDSVLKMLAEKYKSVLKEDKTRPNESSILFVAFFNANYRTKKVLKILLKNGCPANCQFSSSLDVFQMFREKNRKSDGKPPCGFERQLAVKRRDGLQILATNAIRKAVHSSWCSQKHFNLRDEVDEILALTKLVPVQQINDSLLYNPDVVRMVTRGIAFTLHLDTDWKRQDRMTAFPTIPLNVSLDKNEIREEIALLDLLTGECQLPLMSPQ